MFLQKIQEQYTHRKQYILNVYSSIQQHYQITAPSALWSKDWLWRKGVRKCIKNPREPNAHFWITRICSRLNNTERLQWEKIVTELNTHSQNNVKRDETVKYKWMNLVRKNILPCSSVSNIKLKILMFIMEQQFSNAHLLATHLH